MQQTLEPSWWRSARFPGVLRYHVKALEKTFGLAILILLAAQLISLLFPLLTGNPYPYAGVYADISATMVVALICANVAANKSTRFLLRFGTSRLSVWLGTVLSLCVGMVAFLLATLVMSLLVGGLVLLLANLLPNAFQIKSLFSGLTGGALYQYTLSEALRTLPSHLLYTVEWTCLFYLLGCCLRRNRALTLSVLIGVPMLLLTLTLIPAVRQTVEVMQNATQSQQMLLGAVWMKRLVDAAHFIEKEWPIVQLIAAVVSLPLSYLCMRDTQQP